MKYKLIPKDVTMMGGIYNPSAKLFSLADEPHIQRTRKILLIVLGVCLALSGCSVLAAVFGPGIEHSSVYTSQTTTVGEAYFISMLFYGFGIIVAYQYYQTCLRVFAWLGVIVLILFGITIVLLFIAMTGNLPAIIRVDPFDNQDKVTTTPMTIVIIILMLSGSSALTALTVKFAFKLARLIDANRKLTTQQI